MHDTIFGAAEAIRRADAILVGAGAGMGVDSGLPDFRGPEGFWKAYPAFAQRGYCFEEMSSPSCFRDDPEQAWGFFGHRLNLYRDTPPHAGFDILRRWCEGRKAHGFVFTSNVDGHFQRSGFNPDQVLECHGSIHYLQCTRECIHDIWPVGDLSVEVDPETIRAAPPLPVCPHCGSLARPNILMFGDFGWRWERRDAQQRHYQSWLATIGGLRLAVIEIGAGTAIPTVRHACERHAGQLIRINPRDPETPPGGISIPLGGLEALDQINTAMDP